MKLRTRYSKIDADYEVLDPRRITDGSQYVSISQAVEMVARGEALNLHDYTQDSPINTAEFFDVADHAEAIKGNAERVKQKQKVVKLSAETQPEQTKPEAEKVE